MLREELRLLYHLPNPTFAPAHLDAWLAWAARSRLWLNGKIRLISHRAFGFHSADPLIALVYLCCAGVTITVPEGDSTHLGRSAASIGGRNGQRLTGHDGRARR